MNPFKGEKAPIKRSSISQAFLSEQFKVLKEFFFFLLNLMKTIS
jgi:hypothetical protein